MDVGLAAVLITLGTVPFLTSVQNPPKGCVLFHALIKGLSGQLRLKNKRRIALVLCCARTNQFEPIWLRRPRRIQPTRVGGG